MTKKKVLFFVTIALLVVAFGVSAFLVGSYVMESKRQENLYAQYTRPAATIPPTTEATIPAETEAPTTEATLHEETVPTEPTILPDLQQYYDDNPHTVGYIELPGTKLSYPVLQTPENRDYYLDKDFSGKKSAFGAIYAELADINKPSDNITLYGHNMKDGSMFAVLHKYQDKAFWEENQMIFFDTLYERHTYKVFAAFKTNANVGEGWDYHKFIDAENEEDFNEFVRIAKYGRNEGGKVVSFFDSGITPVYGDKIITLSTCEYTMGANGRLVVCAVRWT